MVRRGLELASRTSGEIEISLRWNQDEDRLVVVVDDPSTEEVFELSARRDNALEVFYHPFAYMASPQAA